MQTHLDCIPCFLKQALEAKEPDNEITAGDVLKASADKLEKLELTSFDAWG